MLICLLLVGIKGLMYEFEAITNFLLIELFSDQWPDMKIEVADKQVIQSQIAQGSTQYLQLYYKLRIGTKYNLDIYMLPDNNYTITQVQARDCPNNCSDNGNCASLQCECSNMFTGDYCQYEVTSIYNQTQYSFDIESHQTLMVALLYHQNDLVDNQGETRNLQITCNSFLSTQIYFLLPYEYPSTMLVDSKLVFTGNLSNTAQELDYSKLFDSYQMNSTYYQFVIVFKNQNQIKLQATIKYILQENNSAFQDFLLVAILSVISFIILLIIIYIIRKRCQYFQQTKIKKVKEESSDNILITFMPIVLPAKDQECIICLDSLETRTCRQTPCKHVMHDQCLKQWISKQSSCPICREPLNDVQLSPRALKSRNQTSNTFLNYQIPQLVQSERNSVRSMIVTRSRQSRLAIFQ